MGETVTMQRPISLRPHQMASSPQFPGHKSPLGQVDTLIS